MKHFLSVCLVVVLVATGAWAQEFEQEAAKPRNDLAVTFGLPGILNLSYTLSFTKVIGTRLTGGGIFTGDGYWLGGQGELFFILEHSQTFTADLSLGISAINIDDAKDGGSVAYADIFANIRYRRFFFQIGTGSILSGAGDFKDDGAILPFQLGIIMAKFN